MSLGGFLVLERGDDVANVACDDVPFTVVERREAFVNLILSHRAGDAQRRRREHEHEITEPAIERERIYSSAQRIEPDVISHRSHSVESCKSWRVSMRGASPHGAGSCGSVIGRNTSRSACSLTRDR